MVRPLRRRLTGVGPVQVLDVQIGADADDGLSQGDGDFFTGLGYTQAGSAGGAHLEADSFHRYTNVTIPGGATITNASITTTNRFTDKTGVVRTKIFAEDADDAVAPTSNAEHAADVRTTAGVDWDDPDSGVDVEAQSPDISAVIQEVIDRGSWASGNALMILWDDEGSDDGKKMEPWDYGGDSDKAIKLHVEYTT